MEETLTTEAATPGTPRTPGTPGTAHHPARWVRTRLRANPAAALLMAALAFVTVLLAAADRTAVLARLRTMGLRPRQGLALILVEALPRPLVAAAGGGLVAVAAAVLLGSAFDLSTLVGAAAGHALDPAALPVLLPTAGLALVACLGVVLETLVAGRRQIATELRAGES
ncbi:hypothetical protein [Kitasatospora sp. NPDC096204]|uniref:hypothetical protein n=1 Tax=Kitasatospora sp. NPDC096204 TaxID=3364094 RepID=UPI00380A6C2A